MVLIFCIIFLLSITTLVDSKTRGTVGRVVLNYRGVLVHVGTLRASTSTFILRLLFRSNSDSSPRYFTVILYDRKKLLMLAPLSPDKTPYLDLGYISTASLKWRFAKWTIELPSYKVRPGSSVNLVFSVKPGKTYDILLGTDAEEPWQVIFKEVIPLGKADAEIKLQLRDQPSPMASVKKTGESKPSLVSVKPRSLLCAVTSHLKLSLILLSAMILSSVLIGFLLAYRSVPRDRIKFLREVINLEPIPTSIVPRVEIGEKISLSGMIFAPRTYTDDPLLAYLRALGHQNFRASLYQVLVFTRNIQYSDTESQSGMRWYLEMLLISSDPFKLRDDTGEVNVFPLDGLTLDPLGIDELIEEFNSWIKPGHELWGLPNSYLFMLYERTLPPENLDELLSLLRRPSVKEELRKLLSKRPPSTRVINLASETKSIPKTLIILRVLPEFVPVRVVGTVAFSKKEKLKVIACELNSLIYPGTFKELLRYPLKLKGYRVKKAILFSFVIGALLGIIWGVIMGVDLIHVGLLTLSSAILTSIISTLSFTLTFRIRLKLRR